MHQNKACALFSTFVYSQQIYNKMHEIHSLVGKTPCSYGQNRKEQVVLTRCHIGHGRISCDSNYSLKHVLIDCVDVADIHQTFYNVNNLYDLFTNAQVTQFWNY